MLTEREISDSQPSNPQSFYGRLDRRADLRTVLAKVYCGTDGEAVETTIQSHIADMSDSFRHLPTPCKSAMVTPFCREADGRPACISLLPCAVAVCPASIPRHQLDPPERRNFLAAVLQGVYKTLVLTNFDSRSGITWRHRGATVKFCATFFAQKRSYFLVADSVST